MGSFWEMECRKRGAALTHAHWDKCLSTGTHPGTDEKHLGDQCCHCGERAASWVGPVTPRVQKVSSGSTKDHVYRWTMAGRCGECAGVEDDHPLTTKPDPATGCDVDHRSIDTKLLIGDEGLVRSTCPRCYEMIEPRMADKHNPAPAGRADGKGRGVIMPRMQWRLTAVGVAIGYDKDGGSHDANPRLG